LKSSDMEWFEGLLRGVRQRFPSLWIETLSAAEILSLANGCGLGLRETIARLRDAGLDSIASEDTQAQGSPRCCSTAEWIAVHRAAHRLGMRTVATLRFGAGETLQQRVDTPQSANCRRRRADSQPSSPWLPRSQAVANWMP
jgi:cyclic dehypoxanthinyl futalosine synthase